jgi:hypothetical protein
MRRYYTGKTQTNLYLLDEAKRSLQEKGYNLSQLINDYLIQVDLEETDEMVLKRRIDSIDEEIVNVQSSIDVRKCLIDELIIKKDELQREFDENQKTAFMNKYIRRLNDVIMTWRYDEEVIQEKGKDIIDNILSIDNNFNLTSHIALFKKMMRR